MGPLVCPATAQEAGRPGHSLDWISPPTGIIGRAFGLWIQMAMGNPMAKNWVTLAGYGFPAQ
jgi:hypothetical protein